MVRVVFSREVHPSFYPAPTTMRRLSHVNVSACRSPAVRAGNRHPSPYTQPYVKGAALPVSIYSTHYSVTTVGGGVHPSPSSPRDATSIPRAELLKLFVRSAAPFFGSLVCDNLIMITVGDHIDREFGVVMGFSTIVAAGLGQAVSDGCGVTVQSVIERLEDRLGLPCSLKVTVSRRMRYRA